MQNITYNTNIDIKFYTWDNLVPILHPTIPDNLPSHLFLRFFLSGIFFLEVQRHLPSSCNLFEQQAGRLTMINLGWMGWTVLLKHMGRTVLVVHSCSTIFFERVQHEVRLIFSLLGMFGHETHLAWWATDLLGCHFGLGCLDPTNDYSPKSFFFCKSPKGNIRWRLGQT